MTLILLASQEKTDIISTGSIYTHATVVHPVDDTWCALTSEESGLTCQGTEKPSHIRLPRHSGKALTLKVPGAVCSATPRPTLNSSGTSDVIHAAESVYKIVLPDNREIKTWEIHCQRVVKKEPSEIDYNPPDNQGDNSPALSPEIANEDEQPSTSRKNSTCSGCGQRFETISKLTSHRQGSRNPQCKGKLNTTCGCGLRFETVRKLDSHRKSSRNPQCKGKLNTTCGCGQHFETVSKFNSHRQGSDNAQCKEKLNTTCSCGLRFETVRKLFYHRQGSIDSQCKSKRNTQKSRGNSTEIIRPAT